MSEPSAEPETPFGRRSAAAFESPTDLPKRTWWAVVKRTIAEFKADNLTDWAAALTYYGLLALFPGLLVLIALVGVLGEYPQTIDSAVEILTGAGVASDTVDQVRKPIEEVVQSKGGAGALLGFGTLMALWSASGYVGAFMRASNAIYEVDEGRPFWKLRPLQIALTLAAVLSISVVTIAIVLTGSLAESVGDVIGLGDTAVTVWGIAKWPVLLLITSLVIAVVYWAAPDVRQPSFRWISPGSVLALALWIVATVGFFFYVSNFGSYNKTYGTLGGLIVLLVWMWISNIALLFGAELNAELERSRDDTSA